ncbi:lytic transglycosylase domain-containing protein [Vibrio diabolicus]|uniref:lytic transglycosylase domain-containing protein n=1 Tax=Vibrio diabolicus TaxID=50719 RepID=UPI00215F4B9F|nr:lytic transglycosylase domain-containing protein [Vibrio diabolicus]MCS0367834.1 lytic transglycosylase domain-containing protein [Vibrio diabolicus]
MKINRSKRCSSCLQIQSPSRLSTVGLFIFIALLSCLSITSQAKPSPADIQTQYQVLAPYKPQIAKRLDSSSLVIHHIFKQLQSHSLPKSLALVPMLESSYNPKAVSHANAAGLWQLIPATAQRFGLTVDTKQDDRFDTEASTAAALKYLTFLYNKFDQNVALTLAAYNAGEGRVARAIQRAGSNDFQKLTLPKETRQYVSRFFALEKLIDIGQLQPSSFQPLLLFSSDAPMVSQPLIDFSPLPPLVNL